MNAAEVLAQPVFADGEYKPFSECTLADVRTRAAELSAASRAGPLSRVAGVARAWSELEQTMAAAGVGSVGELDPELAVGLARRAWVAPRTLLR